MAEDNDVKWVVTQTSSKYRRNLFALGPDDKRHIATLISASEKNLPLFEVDMALMRCAPEMAKVLRQTLSLLNDYGFVQSPRARALDRRIREVLGASSRGSSGIGISSSN